MQNRHNVQIILTPSWVLTDESGTLVLQNRGTSETFGPDDIVQFYPSWDLCPARVSVRRAAKIGDRSDDERASIEEFCVGNPKRGHIHIRTTIDRKTAYVRAANAAGKTLSDWITDTCDEKANVRGEARWEKRE